MIWLKNIFKKYIYVLLILLLSSLVIFYRYGQIPQNLSFDEVEFAKLALSLENKPYTPYSPMATGHSTLYFYIILLSFKIFGISKLALRLPAAVFGVLSPAIFYLILKNVFSQTVKKEGFLPFLFSLLFLSSRWYVNFARFSFEATFLLFLELSAIYFLFQCIKTSKRLDLVLTGIFTGLAFNSYTPGRIFFIMIAIFAIAKMHKKDIKKLLYFFVPFIAVILPLSFYLLTNRDTRFDQQFFLKNEQLSIEKKISFLEGNIKADMLMFGFEGDINGRHNYPGKPALNPIINGFFVLGLVISLIKIKNFNNRFFLCYFILSLVPSILTYPWENPNMLRTFTVLPSVIYLVGTGILFLLSYVQKIKLTKTALPIIIFMVTVSSVYEIRTYFKYQRTVFDQAFEVKKNLGELLKINHTK